MHGPLTEIGLIEVLQLLERGRRSGVLRITNANAISPVAVHIAAGVIVAIEPAAGDVATRSALVARHLVADDDGTDDPYLLERPVATRMRGRLASQALETMIYWRQGRFDFAAGAVAPGPLALSPDAVVFDLVGRESRCDELSTALDNFGAIPDFASDQLLGCGSLASLSADDWRLLDQVDGARDVRALAEALDDPLDDVAARIQSLEAALILELRQPAGGVIDQAQLALDGGRYPEAAAMLRERVVVDPNDGEAWRALGLAEVGTGRFAEAIDAWQHWRDNDSERSGDAAALMQAARTMVEALRDARD